MASSAQPLHAVARHHRRVAAASRGRLVAAILATGGLLTGCLMVLAATNAADAQAIWDNGHRTVAPLTGFVAGLVAALSAHGFERRVRAGLALVLGMWALGQGPWIVLLSGGSASFPSLADGVLLAAAAPALAVLVISARRHVSRAQQQAIYLDVLAVFLAVISVGVVVQPLPEFIRHWTILHLIGIGYPTFFLTLAAASLIGAFATKAVVAARGIFLVFAGALVVGIPYPPWIADVART